MPEATAVAGYPGGHGLPHWLGRVGKRNTLRREVIGIKMNTGRADGAEFLAADIEPLVVVVEGEDSAGSILAQ